MTPNALEQSAAGRPSASSDRPARSAADFFFKSASHQAALNEMIAAIRRRDGLIVLTGVPGCGKSTLCQALRKELAEEPFALITPDASRSREDLQKALLVHFGVVTTADLEGPLLGATEVELCSQLYQFINFPTAPRATVLVFDEAERVDAILEEVAAFSDLESEEKLLQVVLVGPPSLRQQLTPEVLKKVGPRTPAWCELKSLTPEETAAYVRHRLAASGVISERIHFSNDALEFIAQHSAGVPRTINEMCDRSIEKADLAHASRIDRKIVSSAVYGDAGEPPAAPALTQLDTAIPSTDRRRANDVDVSGLDVDFDPADLPATSGLASFDPAPEPEHAKRRPRPYARRKPAFSVPPRTIKIASIAAICGVAALVGLRLWTFTQTPVVVEQPRPQPRAATAAPRPAAPAAPQATADGKPAAAPPAGQPVAQSSSPATPGAAAQPGAPAPVASAPAAAAPVATAPVAAAPGATGPAASRPASTASAPERVAAAGVVAAPPIASPQAASAPAAAKTTVAPSPAATRPASAAAAGSAPTARPLPSAPAPAAPASRTPPPSAATAPAAAARPAAPGENYLIEVATFRRPEGAATLVQELKALGLKAYDRQVNLGSRGLMRQVLVGPYDREAATSALARVRTLPDYDDARMRRVE